MTTHRVQPVRVAVLGLTALVMLFHGPSWAQSKRGNEPATQATAASAEAMEPQSLEALLDDTDAIVQGVISEPAPYTTGAGALGHRDDDVHYYPVIVFRVHYPVIVFQRADSTLGLDSGPSWTQTIDVRLVNQAVSRDDSAGAAVHPAGRALTPGAEFLLFLKKDAEVLTVTAAFRIAGERIVPLLPEAPFVQEYAGMKIDDFTVEVLTDLFLRRIQSVASSD